MVSILARIATGDPMAIVQMIEEIRANLAVIPGAEAVVETVLAKYQARLAAGEAALTDDERTALKAAIDANTAAIDEAAGFAPPA